MKTRKMEKVEFPCEDCIIKCRCLRYSKDSIMGFYRDIISVCSLIRNYLDVNKFNEYSFDYGINISRQEAQERMKVVEKLFQPFYGMVEKKENTVD